MLVRRPERLRAAVPGLVLVLLAAVLAAPIWAATTTVTGSLTLPNGTAALTPQAVAIVTIVDHTAAQDAGAIVGEQRIDAPGSVPIAFSVLIDDGAIDQTHAVVVVLRETARKLGSDRLADATIFTTQEPCAMCVGALLESDVEALVFALANPQTGAAGSAIQLAQHPALPRRIKIVSGIRRDEAEALFLPLAAG